MMDEVDVEEETDHVISVIDDDDAASENDVFIGEKPAASGIDYNYPYSEGQDELSCVPQLPCSSQYDKIGNIYKCKNDHGLCCGDKVCYVGACWPMMLLTQALIWGITLAAIFAYGAYVHWLLLAGGVVNMLVTVIALAKTSCTDPGIVERHSEPVDKTWRWSERAQTYYPPGRGITYCSESQVLVKDYDHFCPWTGTTIAGGNMKWFTIFVSSLSLLCVVVIFVTIVGSAAVAVGHIRP